MASCRELEWDTDDSFPHLLTILLLADWNGEQCHSFYRHLTEKNKYFDVGQLYSTGYYMHIYMLIGAGVVDQQNLVEQKLK